MTVFTDLVAKVIIETNRPDLGLITSGGTGEIPQAIQASTLKMHGLDFFFRDVQMAEVVFGTPDYVQSIDVDTLSRYRNLYYIRKWDGDIDTPNFAPLTGEGSDVYNASLGFIELLTPADLIDSYGWQKTDVAFQTGDTIMIQSSTELEYARIGWFKFPEIGDATTATNPTYDSWIAEKHPFAIIYDAASAILQKKGQTDAARKYDSPKGGLVSDQIAQIISTNTTFGGR
jgi:hypothetical protein